MIKNSCASAGSSFLRWSLRGAGTPATDSRTDGAQVEQS